MLAAIFLRGYRTHTKERKTVLNDSIATQKTLKIDNLELKKLVTNLELKEIFKKIEKENVDQVREIWFEHFFERAVCPNCSGRLKNFEH